ncbi:putative cytochrome P450 [Tripterygium wilfordii]|uniref:Putative cytochrome P450 n=1 Tax=Tripterygium wilfordii TaxID=458696 RepID=A0A7J7C563_TRIWF|nr:putative cytochrome P450 [Tripterygium wilfordii]
MAFYGAKKAAVAISGEIQQVIKQKSDAMASGVQMQDILSYMIKAGQEGKFKAPADIAEAIMGLISAGYGTTAIALTFAMKYIGERPDVYQKILAAPTALRCAASTTTELVKFDGYFSFSNNLAHLFVSFVFISGHPCLELLQRDCNRG